MMFDDKLSEMAKKRKGRYLLVNIIMRRSRALYQGSKPLVKTNNPSDAGVVAHEEILGDRLKVTPRKTPPKLIDLAKQNV
jgi:DNA-directed RNA polymerase subunit K/omega